MIKNTKESGEKKSLGQGGRLIKKRQKRPGDQVMTAPEDKRSKKPRAHRRNKGSLGAGGRIKVSKKTGQIAENLLKEKTLHRAKSPRQGERTDDETNDRRGKHLRKMA